MTKNEFLAMIKAERRQAPKEWHFFHETVDGHDVTVKLYNKSVQRMTVDGLQCGGLWDIPTVKGLLDYIGDNIR